MFKALTAIVSFLTACALVRIIPVILALPIQLADLDDQYSFENNLRVFNQTIVLCTRNLRETHIMRLAADTLKYQFPAGRLAIVEQGVQLRHGLTEVPINDEHIILVEPDLYEKNTRFFLEVAHQLRMQQGDLEV